MESFLTPAEAAERLRVEPDTVRRWIRTGVLPASRTPGMRGRYRIHSADLQLVLEPARVDRRRRGSRGD